MTEPLPMSYLQNLKEVEGVTEVGYATWWGAWYQNSRQPILAFAVEPATWLRQHPDMEVAAADATRFLSDRDGMLVSKDLARKFGWKVGDIVPLGSILYAPPSGDPNWQYRVSGIFVSKDSGGGRNYVITHHDYLNQVRGFWRDTVGAFMVSVPPGVRADALASRIDAYFAQSSSRTLSATDRAFHLEFFAQFGDILFVIKCVVGLAFVSLLLITSSTAALSIRQRARDLAMLRMIGFRRLQIVTLVLGETLAVSVMGGLLGLALASGFNAMITRAIPQYLPDIVMPLPVLAEGVAIMLAVGMAAAILPVALAWSDRPVDTFAAE